MKKIKPIYMIQLIIVVILLISAFYLGKLSMSKQVYALYDRVNQLETQINQIQTETLVETNKNQWKINKTSKWSIILVEII